MERACACILDLLGKGNASKVMLAEKIASKDLFAIKIIKKESAIKNNEVDNVGIEKRVLLKATQEDHPFIIKLHSSFQTADRLCFVMEYVPGGDLMLHLQRGEFGAKRAQFYAAEVCLAVEFLHSNCILYRDLKLDNTLLDSDGHIKIADFGLCKENIKHGSKTRTFCGQTEFIAPEILLDQPYGLAIDWWAFGILMYQMLLSQPPFRGENEDEIYDAILSDEPLVPIHMPKDSVDIILKLLTREPDLRLGSGPTGAQEVKQHPYFKQINWEDVIQKKMPVPYIPTIRSVTDTTNFDSEFTSAIPVLTPVQGDLVLTQAMQEQFREFSIISDQLQRAP